MQEKSIITEHSSNFSENIRDGRKRYLTSEEVCEYTGILPKTLDRFAYLNKISYFRRGRRRYFDIREVNKFMRDGLVPARNQTNTVSNNDSMKGGENNE